MNLYKHLGLNLLPAKLKWNNSKKIIVLSITYVKIYCFLILKNFFFPICLKMVQGSTEQAIDSVSLKSEHMWIEWICFEEAFVGLL